MYLTALENKACASEFLGSSLAKMPENSRCALELVEAVAILR